MVKLVELKCNKCGATLENAYEGVEYDEEEDPTRRVGCVTIPAYYGLHYFERRTEYHFLVCNYCGAKYYLDR